MQNNFTSLQQHTLSAEQLTKFDSFFDVLTEWNEKFNLTSITEKNDVENKHFLDSLLGCDFFPQNCSVCDVGAGAGFPSIPLAIFRNDLRFTLLDSLNKRVTFLNAAAEHLSLRNVCALHFRAEDFAKEHRNSFDAVCARAVAPLPTLLEITVPLAKINGLIILYKTDEGELDVAKNAISKLNVKLIKNEKFTLTDGANRRIFVFKKIAATPNLYPRGGNKPRLMPL